MVSIWAETILLDCEGQRRRRDIYDRDDCAVRNLVLKDPGNESISFEFDGDDDERLKVIKLFLYGATLEVLPKQLFEVFPKLQILAVLKSDVGGKLKENLLKDMGQLKKISFDNDKITEVHPNAFKELKNIEIIELFLNDLKTLPEDVFKYNLELKTLELDENGLETIDPNTFKYNKKLRKIDLNSNELESLPENLFSELPELEEIFLLNNRLKEIPENLFKNNLKLRKIDLNSNFIEKIGPGTFRHLKNLEFLYIAGNECVSRQFGLDAKLDMVDEDLKKCYDNWK